MRFGTHETKIMFFIMVMLSIQDSAHALRLSSPGNVGSEGLALSEYEIYSRELESQSDNDDEFWQIEQHSSPEEKAAREAIQQQSIKVPELSPALSGKHIVMIGDSIMRYQYLNLAYHFVHGHSPDFEFFEKSGHWGKYADENFWRKFYNQSNQLLKSDQSKATCDCWRAKCCDDTIENRYFSHQQRNVHLTYLQWFYPYSFKGHWSPSKGSEPEQSCAAGNCAPPASWEIPKHHAAQLLEDFVVKLKPTPTHVVMNSAKWGHMTKSGFVSLVKAGKHIKDKYGTKFIWKTETRGYKSSSTSSFTKEEVRMARDHDWDVFDVEELTLPLRNQSWAYSDKLHMSELVNSYLNSVFLTSI